MERRWVFPKRNFVKINTHTVTLPHRLPNGNNMGLGVVIRDHRGSIVLMVSEQARIVDGVQIRTRLVVFRRGFGRVRELWRLDMGLGLVDERFQVVEEDEAEAEDTEEEDEEVEGMGEWLVQHLGSQSLGRQN
ncbi:hypothetical protein POM88_043359 [Heracleum sosnowskyi]|uniref:RNase H type-1 domain-containing protein n=1 Tax=Heracleum sosnowskyi TaxID=360622 RepID=A0AAD8H3C4_9APIA|nr:hypothetical protein POM88_043359 [Heracleum sosnowskyi]